MIRSGATLSSCDFWINSKKLEALRDDILEGGEVTIFHQVRSEMTHYSCEIAEVVHVTLGAELLQLVMTSSFQKPNSKLILS